VIAVSGSKPETTNGITLGLKADTGAELEKSAGYSFQAARQLVGGATDLLGALDSGRAATPRSSIDATRADRPRAAARARSVHFERVTYKAGEIHLTPKAFDLLTLLIASAGRVVTKKELHERLWPDTFVSDATLVGLIKMLRRTLGDHDRRAPTIRTMHGVGYAFVAPIAQRPSSAESRPRVPFGSLSLDSGVVVERHPLGGSTAVPSSVAVLPFADLSSQRDKA
jgi:DNA-binding winged helix-turn-helix (wHTH) protein